MDCGCSEDRFGCNDRIGRGHCISVSYGLHFLNDAGVEKGAASGHLIPERPCDGIFKGGASCQEGQGH